MMCNNQMQSVFEIKASIHAFNLADRNEWANTSTNTTLPSAFTNGLEGASVGGLSGLIP